MDRIPAKSAVRLNAIDITHGPKKDLDETEQKKKKLERVNSSNLRRIAAINDRKVQIVRAPAIGVLGNTERGVLVSTLRNLVEVYIR